MAIGDTVQAGLMRFDSSAYERAGQANAQANAAFGNALSMAAKGFYEGQEKKARAKEIEEDLIRNGEDPAAAKAISKNPFLQKEHQRREATKTQLQIEGNRLALQRQLGTKANKLRKKMFDLEKRREDRDIERSVEDEESRGRIIDFLLAPRPEEETPEYKELLQKFGPEQIPGTPEFQQKELSDPMGARVPIMVSQKMMQPDFERFRAPTPPGIARLPKRFQLEAQRIADATESGMLTLKDAEQLFANVEARAIAEAPEAMSLEDRLDYLAKVEELERKRRGDKRSQVEEERKDEEFEGEQKIKSFDGLKFEGLELQGSIQDATEAKKAKEGLLNFNAVMRDLDRLKELGELREEKTILKDDLKKEAAIISNRVRGQIRESILGPGTVNDSERKILVEQVPDPTEGFDLFSATYGEEGVALIEKLQNNLRKKVANNFANYGVTFKQSAGQASGRPTNSPPSESIRLGSGDEVEVFRLDR